jgi:hypothetical protein
LEEETKASDIVKEFNPGILISFVSFVSSFTDIANDAPVNSTPITCDSAYYAAELHPENRRSMNLRNVGNPPQHYTVSQPKDHDLKRD